jgi:hypothetical protein
MTPRSSLTTPSADGDDLAARCDQPKAARTSLQVTMSVACSPIEVPVRLLLCASYLVVNRPEGVLRRAVAKQPFGGVCDPDRGCVHNSDDHRSRQLFATPAQRRNDLVFPGVAMSSSDPEYGSAQKCHPHASTMLA